MRLVVLVFISAIFSGCSYGRLRYQEGRATAYSEMVTYDREMEKIREYVEALKRGELTADQFLRLLDAAKSVEQSRRIMKSIGQ